MNMKTISGLISVVVVASPYVDHRAIEGLGGHGEPPAERGPAAEARASVTTMMRIHDAPMSRFLQYRSQRHGAPDLDWSTDACSLVADASVAFDFIAPCIRHDFGYRNYRRYRIFTKANRKLIDTRFLADMKAHCATRGLLLKLGCYEIAYAYYAGVRVLGR